MKMYLTANVLDAGIQSVDATLDEAGSYAAVGINSYKIGFNIHHSMEEAIVCAEKQRAKKVASLEKHIATLQRQATNLPERRFDVSVKE